MLAPIKKSLKVQMIVLLGLTISTNALARRVVVCFDGPADRAIRSDRLTELGRKNLKSVESYEYYRVKSKAKDTELISKIENLEYRQATKILSNSFGSIPKLKYFLNRTLVKDGYIDDGIGNTSSLEDRDYYSTGPVVLTSENCGVVTAVVKQHDTFFYDSDLWDLLPDFQKAIIQTLEQLFNFDEDEVSRDSVRLLVMSHLSKKLTEKEMLQKLSRYGFDKLETKNNVSRYLSAILKMIKYSRSDLMLIRDFCVNRNGSVKDALYASNRFDANLTQMHLSKKGVWDHIAPLKQIRNFFNPYQLLR
jgi:hypothetical protein